MVHHVFLFIRDDLDTTFIFHSFYVLGQNRGAAHAPPINNLGRRGVIRRGRGRGVAVGNQPNVDVEPQPVIVGPHQQEHLEPVENEVR